MAAHAVAASPGRRIGPSRAAIVENEQDVEEALASPRPPAIASTPCLAKVSLPPNRKNHAGAQTESARKPKPAPQCETRERSDLANRGKRLSPQIG